MSSIGRASANVAAGTLVSRLTGLVRTVVLTAALGTTAAGAADAFALANNLPNNIYALISSGLLAGVIVPQIVKAARHPDGGSAFVSKLLTLGVVTLGAATVIAVIAAPLLVQLYGNAMKPDGIALALAFAYWCLPQVFFYGLYALLGEILNARRVFGPFAWSPIINNIVSIIGFLAFIWIFGVTRSASGWSMDMILLMAGTATFGIVCQAVVLLFFWRKAGLSVRLDFQWRGIGLRGIGRLAGWTFLMVVVGQIAGLIQVRLVSAASGDHASIAAMQYAWLVFVLPFSVIVMSIGTPYFTRLSEHVAQKRIDAVRADLDVSTRVISVLMIGALAAMVAAILPISRVFTQDREGAGIFSLILAAYLIALIPLSVQFVIQRTFYAYHDTRSPFLFTLVQCVLVIVTAVICRLTLPLEHLAIGIALGQSVANIVQLAMAIWMLRRKMGTLGLAAATRSIVRDLCAAIPAGALGFLIFHLLGGFHGWFVSDRFPGIVGTVLIGGITFLIYVAFLAVLRSPELATAGRALRRFLPGR